MGSSPAQAVFFIGEQNNPHGSAQWLAAVQQPLDHLAHPPLLDLNPGAGQAPPQLHDRLRDRGRDGQRAQSQQTIMVISAMLVLIIPMMLSTGLRSSVEALFERGDMDLLLSTGAASVIPGGRRYGFGAERCQIPSVL